MNKFKKIGLTALAASLVSVSAHAAELSVSGGASITASGKSASEGLNGGTSFTMGNSVTFTGSGELDNGLTVSVSFELDQGATENANATSGATTETASDDVFDSHSVSISSDTLGTLTFAGHGGSSASSAIDTTVAGDIWDNFDGTTGGTGLTAVVGVSTVGGGNDSFFYTSPELTDGLTFTASYNGQVANGGAESEMGFGVNYTGVEGLSVHYAVTDEETGTATTSGDNTVLKATYAYGPVTVGYSSMEHDEALSTGANDVDVTSYSVSYTISDELSVSYGEETVDNGAQSIDQEYTEISASYTAGGMTISGVMATGDDLNFGTDANEDLEYWELGVSFAF
jgi:outer membrane protein OmpU